MQKISKNEKYALDSSFRRPHSATTFTIAYKNTKEKLFVALKPKVVKTYNNNNKILHSQTNFQSFKLKIKFTWKNLKKLNFNIITKAKPPKLAAHTFFLAKNLQRHSTATTPPTHICCRQAQLNLCVNFAFFSN